MILLAWGSPLLAESRGELRLQVLDPTGLGVKSAVTLVSEANDVRRELQTDDAGRLVMRHLPEGRYEIEVASRGFSSLFEPLDIRSAVPTELTARLRLASVVDTVSVGETSTLVDPHGTGEVQRIGTDTISGRPTSLPGRSLAELVLSEPGWVEEGSAVLHPRGSEYQTQFVVDGVPMTDDRSPGFAPEIEADDVQEVTIYTAGIPAEYGRKMGGVVEVTTSRDDRPGLHGKALATGGSFDTAGGYAAAAYSWNATSVGLSAGGGTTDRYLNPPVVENYTNSATTGDFSARFDSELTDNDRLGASLHHGFTRFLVPNELLQEAAGQRQDRDNFEDMGTLSYQHIFGSSVLGDVRLMARDDALNLRSNPASTPIVADQARSFREAYLKAALSAREGAHELKVGVEGDFMGLREGFHDVITDPSRFDPGTPPTFDFSARAPDREQAAFAEDIARLGPWTLSIGLRFDHYHLLVDQAAVSPRASVGRYFASLDLLLHASYDRVFETPAFENILLSSSPQVAALNPSVLRLPVVPSRGNYFEVGFAKAFGGKWRLAADAFDRAVSNFADDDQLLNTGVSFPIAFRRANIYGAEAKLDLPRWGGLSGSFGYSYMVGSAYLPVTGGLFLGVDATTALAESSGRFWVSQDQRNTARSRLKYQFLERAFVAVSGAYGSGLPVAFDGTEQDALQQYGRAAVEEVDFVRGRVKPSFSLDASLSVSLLKRGETSLRMQCDVRNVFDRLNVIDFAGLFSGNAIGPPRSVAARFELSF